MLTSDRGNSSSRACKHPAAGRTRTMVAHASCLCWEHRVWHSREQSQALSELLDTVIWATAGPGWLALAYTLQLVSSCNTLKGTAKQSVLTYLPTKRRKTLSCNLIATASWANCFKVSSATPLLYLEPVWEMWCKGPQGEQAGRWRDEMSVSRPPQILSGISRSH